MEEIYFNSYIVVLDTKINLKNVNVNVNVKIPTIFSKIMSLHISLVRNSNRYLRLLIFELNKKQNWFKNPVLTKDSCFFVFLFLDVFDNLRKGMGIY